MQNIKEKFTNWPEWIKAIGIVISPLVALYIGNSFSDSIKDREIQTRYVELAISILREAPKPETQGLREWAVTTVNAYAKVPLAPDVRKELIEHRITGQASLPAESSECMRLPQNVERQIQSFSNDIGIEYCESRESVQGDLDGDLVKDLVVAISVYPCGKDANGSPVSCGNGAIQHLLVFLGKSYRLIPPRQVGIRGERYIGRLKIERNTIKAEVIRYVPGDAMCCPSAKGKTEFILKDNVVVEMVR